MDDSKVHQRLDAEAEPLWAMPLAEVRNKLVEHYLQCASIAAAKAVERNPKVTWDDCYSECCLALVECVSRFNPRNERGAKFTTFYTARAGFQSVEAARFNDGFIPPKVRSADNRAVAAGAESQLPTVGGFANSMEQGVRAEMIEDRETEPELRSAEATLATLTAQVNPAVRYFAAGMARAGQFSERLGEEWGCSPMVAAVCRNWAIEKLRGAKL